MGGDQFKNGDKILHAKTDKEWEAACKAKKPAWCYTYNDASLGVKYGKFYNLYAVLDPRGLAPKGWQIPTREDFITLRDFLGGENYAGRRLKSKEGWDQNHGDYKEKNGDNSSGFNAFPAGQRAYLALAINGGSGKGDFAIFWTTTENKHYKAFFTGMLDDGGDQFYISPLGKDTWGLSVRCIKDK